MKGVSGLAQAMVKDGPGLKRVFPHTILPKIAGSSRRPT